MNKELLANIRNVLIPILASRLKKTNYEGQGEKDAIEFTHDMIEIFDLAEQQLSAQPRWIPFETREPDAEEKQEHPEWDFVLCGKLPQDGQRILVNIKYKGHEAVQMDEYNDDGRECYLYSGYDIATEATAWMPLPEPWEGQDD